MDADPKLSVAQHTQTLAERSAPELTPTCAEDALTKGHSMSKPSFTPGPWRHSTTSNIGNLIEGPTGKKLYEGDDGFRGIATVQPCIASTFYADQEENCKANINLIAASPELYEALERIQKEMAKYVQVANEIGINDADGFYLGHAMEVERQAREALAKARGEQ